MGNDVAIWGLVHDFDWWATPGVADVVRRRDGSYAVMCAAVHRSYDYVLDPNGKFGGVGGGSAESFDVKVEQSAVMIETRCDGRHWEYVSLRHFGADSLDDFRAAVGAKPVPEASDAFSSIWKAPDAIWHERSEHSYALFVPADARERIAALFRKPR